MNRTAGWAAALALAAAPLAAQNLSTAPPAAPRPETRKAPPSRPKTYGTTRVTYVSVPPNAFQPYSRGQTYASDNFGLGTSLGHQRTGRLGGSTVASGGSENHFPWS